MKVHPSLLSFLKNPKSPSSAAPPSSSNPSSQLAQNTLKPITNEEWKESARQLRQAQKQTLTTIKEACQQVEEMTSNLYNANKQLEGWIAALRQAGNSPLSQLPKPVATATPLTNLKTTSPANDPAASPETKHRTDIPHQQEESSLLRRFEERLKTLEAKTHQLEEQLKEAQQANKRKDEEIASLKRQLDQAKAPNLGHRVTSSKLPQNLSSQKPVADKSNEPSMPTILGSAISTVWQTAQTDQTPNSDTHNKKKLKNPSKVKTPPHIKRYAQEILKAKGLSTSMLSDTPTPNPLEASQDLTKSWTLVEKDNPSNDPHNSSAGA